LKCIFKQNKQLNPSFTANARVVRKSYYKLTDNLADHTVKRATGGMSIEIALSDIAGKTVDSMRNAYGDFFDCVCTNYRIVKEKFPQSNLADALKGLCKSFKIVDENGVFNKSPLRVLVIKPGTGHLDDIAADTIVNDGVSGLKKIEAKNVRVNNVNDPELNIYAKWDCKVNNSTCNFISSETTELKNVTAIMGITSEEDILATNVIAPTMTSKDGEIYLHGENNSFNSLTAYFSIISSDGLIAKNIKSVSGDILLEGKINKIDNVDANGLFAYKDLPESDNFVNYVDAKDIEAVNAKGMQYCANDSLSLFGLKNDVETLIANGEIELENIIASSVNSLQGSINFIGKSNIVDDIISAEKVVTAKNLNASIIECLSFIDKGNVKVQDLRISKVNP